MKNFIFKSSYADLQKIVQSIERLNSNVIYVTHQVDFIRKKIMAMEHDKDLQNTVDKFYESDGTTKEPSDE